MSEQIIGLGYEVVQFLLVVVWIAGLVVCIVYQRVSRSMILLIIGFAGELVASLLPYATNALRSTATSSSDLLGMRLFTLLIRLLSPLSAGLIVMGLLLVFQEWAKRMGRGADLGAWPPRRRPDDYDDPPAPRPRRPGSPDIER